MTTAELTDAVKRKPFTPFTIKMADGSHYRVPGPEWILYPKPVRLCTVFDTASNRVQLLDLLTMTDLEYDEPPSLTGKDGDAEKQGTAA